MNPLTNLIFWQGAVAGTLLTLAIIFGVGYGTYRAVLAGLNRAMDSTTNSATQVSMSKATAPTVSHTAG